MWSEVEFRCNLRSLSAPPYPLHTPDPAYNDGVNGMLYTSLETTLYRASASWYRRSVGYIIDLLHYMLQRSSIIRPAIRQSVKPRPGYGMVGGYPCPADATEAWREGYSSLHGDCMPSARHGWD